MTQKEIHNFLANTKVYVNGKSKEIQEKLFSLGYSWNEECTGTDVCHTEAPFLFIYEDTSITMSREMDVFCDHENSEISAEEILSLELTEPTYRPFKDKDECWNEIQKHHPILWVLEEDMAFTPINKISDIGIHINNDTYFYNESFEKLKFADGTPFGILE